MNNTIEVKFLGTPSIKIDDKLLILPFSKAYEIFYLILFKISISRDELCSIVYDSTDDLNMKKNLRNAIYIIRKNTDENIIISPKRHLLELNPEIKLIRDIDIIESFCPETATDEQIISYIDAYGGDFLTHFAKTISNAYEQWVIENSSYYRNTYVTGLLSVSEMLMHKNFVMAEKCIRKVISLDEFDEHGYELLMKLYIEKKRYKGAVRVYDNLEKILSDNLSVKPSKELQYLKDEAVKNVLANDERLIKNHHISRVKELKILKDNLCNFLSDKSYKSFVVCGEAGIGKTTLLNNFCEAVSEGVILIKLTCYEFESNFVLKLWDRIFSSLSNFINENKISVPSDTVRKIHYFFPTLKLKGVTEENTELHVNSRSMDSEVCKLFAHLCKNKHVILAIDDINWADRGSADLIKKVILTNRCKIMLISTCRREFIKDIEGFYYEMQAYTDLQKISLERLSLKETYDFIHAEYPECDSYSPMLYKESEGIPFFMVEMINNIKSDIIYNNMSDNMTKLIGERICRLNANLRQLISICSMFYDTINLDVLMGVSDMRDYDLIEAVDELLKKNILQEDPDAKNCLMFTHQKIREFIYNTTSQIKRAFLHEKIGCYIESELFHEYEDRVHYPNLIYHFKESGNEYKYFKYKIKRIQLVCNLSHEIFPVINNGYSEGIFEHYNDVETMENEFNELYQIYERVICRRNYIEEKIVFLYLYGRFTKDRGKPKKALKLFYEMIDIGLKHREFINYAFESYVQIIQSAINTNNLDTMKAAVSKAYDIAVLTSDRLQMAVIKRHKGYCSILEGDYAAGEQCIIESKDMFDSMSEHEKYRLNTAASYFYIGESKRMQGNMEEAQNYYESAFELCDEETDFPSTALILLRIGYIKYKLALYDEAQFYLLKSIKAYNKTIFSWGRADAHYYLYKVYDKKDMHVKAKSYYDEAQRYLKEYGVSLSLI